MASIVSILNRDHLPGIYRANLYRLYTRVIAPALEQLQPRRDLVIPPTQEGEALTAELERHIFNAMAFEARRSFALTLSASFERQLRIWSRRYIAEAKHLQIPAMTFERLLDDLLAARQPDIHADTITAIKELHLVANAVRHGDGLSVDILFSQAPDLWPRIRPEYAERTRELSLLAEFIEIEDEQMRRYARALLKFWECADFEPSPNLEI